MNSTLFKPPIDRTPSIRPHKMYLAHGWMGDAVYTVEEIERMIAAMQLAVAEQRKRGYCNGTT